LGEKTNYGTDICSSLLLDADEELIEDETFRDHKLSNPAISFA